MTPFPCPHCGEEVREGALVCRACGADVETGWADDADAEGQDLPEGTLDADDYEDFLAREGLGGRRRRSALPRRRGARSVWMWLALVAALVSVAGLIFVR